MSEKVLRSKYPGKLQIGDIDLECHVLEDGSRIFSSHDVLLAFGLDSDPKNQPRVLNAFLDKIKVISLSDNELSSRLKTPIRFTRDGKGGSPAIGYPAELIPAICNSVLKLSTSYKLPFALNESAVRSRILLNGFANVGILALVDEATGYQEYRDKRALQDILDKYLRQEYAAWAKCFPDEFYKEMFRLKNWEWKGMSINRPSVVGKYTNNIVYARLAPGVLAELEKRNPASLSGHRKIRHHQFLTDEVGHPELNKHLYAVIALMKNSNDWGQFTRSLARVFPVYGQQIEFDLDDE